MTLDVSDVAKQCLSEKGYDARYGARPLKRVLAKDLLNPLSRLVLDGGVVDGDVVKVRTCGEAKKIQANEDPSLSWISSSSMMDEDKNSIVLLRNHESVKGDDEVWDDDEFLLEDGTHPHR